MAGEGFLAGLSPERRRILLTRGTRKLYTQGTTIFARGEPGDALFFLETGRAEISMRSVDGRRSVLNHLGPGAVLGELSGIDRGPRSADVIAAANCTGVLLAHDALRVTLTQHPEIMFALLVEVTAKLRETIAAYETLAGKEAGMRLSRCLLRLAERWGEGAPPGPVVIGRGFSQGDLGDLAGLARENVNRYLRRWGEEGILRIEDRGIALVDHGALRAMAGLADMTD